MQLDPEIEVMLMRARHSSASGVGNLSLQDGRAAYAQRYLARGLPHLPDIEVRDLEIPGQKANLSARLYRAPGQAHRRPVALYLHGGGFVLGDAEAYDNQSRQLAQQSGVDILFLNYRLALEAKFPKAVEDAIFALTWAQAQAEELNFDPNRIGLCGDSAGGNLAISTALHAARSGAPVKAVILLYPVTDFRPFTTGDCRDYPSIAAYGDGYFLDTSLMKHFADLYLTSPHDADSPLASPILATDLTALPPHIVITAGHDPLRDQGFAFHQAAKKAGSDSDYICHEGMIHNFMGQGGVSKGAAMVFAAVAKELNQRMK